MVFSLNDIFFALIGVAGLAYCALGYYADDRWNEPGIRAFAAFAILFGAGTICSSFFGIRANGTFNTQEIPLWILAFLFTYAVSAVPWFLFSLQHTGHVTKIKQRYLSLLVTPIAFGILALLVEQMGYVESETILGFLVTITVVLTLNIFGITLLFLGSVIHIRATWTYGHISLGRGIVLALTPVAPLVFEMVSVNWADAVSENGAIGLLFMGYVVSLGTLSTALFYYNTFASTPAAGSIGKRQVTKQMDDCVVVTDHREQVIELNQATTETFDVSADQPLGNPLEALLGADIDTLRASDEVSLHTTEGHRQFDVLVSEISDQHDRWLGFIVTLHDVTRREIREQRLEVLNRILRHNLRNKLTVVKASAEIVTDDEVPESNEEISQHIQDAVDELLALSERAKNIGQLMHESRQASTPFSLERAVEGVADDVRAMHLDAMIETSVDRNLVVYADEALFVHMLWNVVDNAARHNDAENPSVTVNVSHHPNEPHQVVIEVADNGPGIPDHELEVIRQGHETDLDHTSGLGLWATSWAVRYLGGAVSFGENDPRGTVVQIELPDSLFVDEEQPDFGHPTEEPMQQDY